MSTAEIAPTNLDLELLLSPDSPLDAEQVGFAIAITTEAASDQMVLGSVIAVIDRLHHLVRDSCSDRYRELRNQYPERSKEEINEDPLLMALNGTRRTLHQALERKQSLAKSNRASQRRSIVAAYQP